jgi:transcription antitermination factor NusG
MLSEVDSDTNTMGLTVRELRLDVGLDADPCQWFALTVKRQHERRVEGVLRAAGVDTFLPLYRARRQWSDRVKDLDAPLFPGYVFGRCSLRDRARIVKTPGVARIVGFAGLPAPVAQQEIEGVRAALASKLPLGPWPYFSRAGGRVRIERGPLRGLEGTLLREGSCLRLVLGVELLQRSLAVEVDPEMIGPIFN